MKKKQTQANRYNLQYHHTSAHSGSRENTNEESPSLPIKATMLFLLSLKIFKIFILQSSSKNAFVSFFLYGLTWKLFSGSSKQMAFYNCHCCKFSHRKGGEVSFFQLPPTVRHSSWNAVSILLRMHKPKNVLPKNQAVLHQFTFTRQAADAVWAVMALAAARWVGGWVLPAHVLGSDATIHSLSSQQKSIFIRKFSWNTRLVREGMDKAL